MGRLLRVLVVEDSVVDTQLLVRMLERAGLEVTHERVETPEDLAKALAAKAWDVVLSDHSMPRMSSARAQAIVEGTGLDIPFIIVSGRIGEAAAVDALKKGAHDYISKDQLARLVPAIDREIAAAVERTRHKQAQRDLRDSEAYLRAVTDTLPDGVLTFAEGGAVLSFNPAAVRIFAWPLGDALGEDVRQMIPDVLDHVGAGPVRLRGIRGDGTEHTLQVTVSEMPLTGRKVFCCTVRDPSADER